MIWILDNNFKKIDILRKYTFSQYNDKSREIGTFEIHIEIVEENLYLLDKTKTYYVLFDEKILGKVENVTRDSDGEFDKSIIVQGRLAMFILQNRVIDGTIVFSGNTAQYVRALLFKSFIDTKAERKLNFHISYYDEQYINNVCSQVDKQVTGGALFEEIQPYLEQDFLSIDIIPNVIPSSVYNENTTNISDFDLIISAGRDKRKWNNEGNTPVIFSQSLSNIARTSYSYNSEDYKNVAYIAGEGEDDERKWYEVMRYEADEPSGWDRAELWIDARDIQSEQESEGEEKRELTEDEYKELIVQRTNEKFTENDITEEYNATVTDVTRYRYGIDYYKGDFVTVVDDELGLTVDAQVTGVIVSEQDSRIITDVELTYGVVRKKTNEQKVLESKIETVQNNITYIDNKVKQQEKEVEQIKQSVDDMPYSSDGMRLQNAVTFTAGTNKVIYTATENCFVTIRANFSAAGGYIRFFIHDENNNDVFRHQLNAGGTYSNQHETPPFYLKAGWKIYLPSTDAYKNITNAVYVVTK